MHNFTNDFFFMTGLKLKKQFLLFTLDLNLKQGTRSLPTGEILLPKRRKRIIIFTLRLANFFCHYIGKIIIFVIGIHIVIVASNAKKNYYADAKYRFSYNIICLYVYLSIRDQSTVFLSLSYFFTQKIQVLEFLYTTICTYEVSLLLYSVQNMKYLV